MARSNGRKRWVLVASCTGYAMVILDTTVVNVALPALSRDLHATTSGLQWVVDGYTLVFAVLLLSGGALGDRRGAKGAFLAGMGLFSLASLACGLAPSVTALVAARLVQGVGAAVAVPSSLVLVQAAYPEQAARARAVGTWGAMAGVAAGVGPALGGLLVEALGWRAVFFVNLPVGAFGLVLGARTLPRPPRHAHGIDLPGQAVAVVCLGALAVALIEAGSRGWGAPVVLEGLGVFTAAAVLLVVVERRVAHPMLPPALFSSPTLSAATIVGCCANLGFFGELFVMSLYLQEVRHYSPLLAGLALTPQIATTVLGSVLSGRAMARTGPRPPMLTGLAIGAAGLLAIALAGAHSPYWSLLPCFVAAGFGISFTMMAATASVLEDAPAARGGTASGALNASRQVGGMVGVALLGSLVAGRSGLVSGLHLAMVVAAGSFAAAWALTAAFVRQGRRTSVFSALPPR